MILSYNGSVQVLTEILSCLLPMAANDRTGTSVSGAEDREVRWCGEVYRDVPHVVTSEQEKNSKTMSLCCSNQGEGPTE